AARSAAGASSRQPLWSTAWPPSLPRAHVWDVTRAYAPGSVTFPPSGAHNEPILHLSGGTTVPEERLQPAQLEPICIRTTQVYDWCYLNGTTSVLLPDIVFPADTSVVAGIEAAIISVECAEIDRDQDPSGLANVTIRRLVTFELTFVDVNGNPVPVIVNGVEVTTQTRSRFFDEFIRVCAPDGTTLTCEITDAAARAF